ncbi:hypothetical protein [Roseomonas sp. KE0001]|uniref:hypothetical protein n=1 Tax=Roseomonas sp. KE0001 TaxID=2479201 RepID=UPI0018E03BCE|nr:hypothetical protein [Roseomonas sp. KE0001]MBI0432815.1 hypothetical protein [Roseomonas sp. KE0001]
MVVAYLLEKKREIHAEIEHLLDRVEILLAQADALDGDPDLEPDADGEPEAELPERLPLVLCGREAGR